MSCQTRTFQHTHEHSLTHTHTEWLRVGANVCSLPFPGYRQSVCLLSQSAASLVVTEFGWRRSEGGREKVRDGVKNGCFLASVLRNFTVWFPSSLALCGCRSYRRRQGLSNFIFWFIYLFQWGRVYWSIPVCTRVFVRACARASSST